MRPSIDLQDVVVEIFHSQAEAGHAEVANGFKFVSGQRARLAFERNLFSLVPWQQSLHAVSQMPELLDRQVRRRAAPEIDEIKLASADKLPASVELKLAQNRIEVFPNLGGILVRIDFEITEVAALATKGDVDVK